ncbi:MAG TPA: phosphate signaling complex protein PhoU [Flavisolibacter sp.]|jgi:phosphate transport system protein|nr:phosphate signaling complex protein PhoU [Flavisolibacter sp.]
MTHLQEKLSELRADLVEMADLVARQLDKSVHALLDGDEDLANEVIFNEKRVNAFELKIDSDCEQIFTLLAPFAQDMRFVFSTVKINADLERIGDYAEGIAKLVLLGKKDFDPSLIETIHVREMFDAAMGMLQDVTTAYAEDDSRLARTLFARDEQLNEINRNVAEWVGDYVKQNLGKIRQALLLLSIIRKLERVGDHIKNIAEDVIFYKEAKVLKHIDKKDPS